MNLSDLEQEIEKIEEEQLALNTRILAMKNYLAREKETIQK